jgi:hypothetical protein
LKAITAMCSQKTASAARTSDGRSMMRGAV